MNVTDRRTMAQVQTIVANVRRYAPSDVEAIALLLGAVAHIACTRLRPRPLIAIAVDELRRLGAGIPMVDPS